MFPPGPPFHGIDWDDALENHPACSRVLTKSALAVEVWLKVQAPSTLLTLGIVEGLHSALFQGLFPYFAGRLRGEAPRYLPSNVDFGNRKATRYEDVPLECQTLFLRLEALIRQLDQLEQTMGRPDFEEEVLKVACYAHCEVIRIHPFRNGNGRACINYFARRYGMLPVPFERPKGNYLDANRSWMDRQRIEHMMDVIRPFWKRNPLP